jgi:hypothetical protein
VVKQAGRGNDHESTSRDEIKNEWSYTSTPLYAFIEWTAATLPLFLCTDMNDKNDMFCKDVRSGGKVAH